MLIDSSRPPLIHVGWLSQQQTARAGPLSIVCPFTGCEPACLSACHHGSRTQGLPTCRPRHSPSLEHFPPES